MFCLSYLIIYIIDEFIKIIIIKEEIRKCVHVRETSFVITVMDNRLEIVRARGLFGGDALGDTRGDTLGDTLVRITVAHTLDDTRADTVINAHTSTATLTSTPLHTTASLNTHSSLDALILFLKLRFHIFFLRSPDKINCIIITFIFIQL